MAASDLLLPVKHVANYLKKNYLMNSHRDTHTYTLLNNERKKSKFLTFIITLILENSFTKFKWEENKKNEILYHSIPHAKR